MPNKPPNHPYGRKMVGENMCIYHGNGSEFSATSIYLSTCDVRLQYGGICVIKQDFDTWIFRFLSNKRICNVYWPVRKVNRKFVTKLLTYFDTWSSHAYTRSPGSWGWKPRSPDAKISTFRLQISRGNMPKVRNTPPDTGIRLQPLFAKCQVIGPGAYAWGLCPRQYGNILILLV